MHPWRRRLHSPPMRDRTVAAAQKIAAGDVEGGLGRCSTGSTAEGHGVLFRPMKSRQFETTPTRWSDRPTSSAQPFSRADAELIRTPTLLVGGEKTPGSLPVMLRALAAHIPGAQVEIIPNAAHFMFGQDPLRFCRAVTAFLAE